MDTTEEEYLEIKEDGAQNEIELIESTTENWNQADTFHLIELFKANQNAYRADGHRSKFWNCMQKELANCDIIKTTKNIRTKWSNLIRTYKQIIRNQAPNKEPKKFAFFWALDEILKHEPFGSEAVQNKIDGNKSNDAIDDDDSDNEFELPEDANGESDSNRSYGSDGIRSKRQWKNEYYSSKISELEDRRRFRDQKLRLAFAREKRKTRHLELKERKFELAKMQFELDKRKLALEKEKLTIN